MALEIIPMPAMLSRLQDAYKIPLCSHNGNSMDSISMSRLCKSQATVGGAVDEISGRLIAFDYRNS
jgi:hypothetical protein